MAEDEKDRLNDLLSALRAGEPENLPGEPASEATPEEAQAEENGEVERVLNKMSEMAAAEPEAEEPEEVEPQPQPEAEEPEEAEPQPQPDESDAASSDTKPNLSELLEAVAEAADEEPEESEGGDAEGDDVVADGSSEEAEGTESGAAASEANDGAANGADADETTPETAASDTEPKAGDESAPSLEALLAEVGGNEAEPQEPESAPEPEAEAASEQSAEEAADQPADSEGAPADEQEAKPVVRVLGGDDGSSDAPPPKVELQTQQEIQKILSTMTLDDAEGEDKAEGDSILTKTELDSLSPDEQESPDEEESKDVLPMPQPAVRSSWVSAIGALTALNSLMLLGLGCLAYSVLHRPAVTKVSQPPEADLTAESKLDAEVASKPVEPSPVAPVNAFQQYMRTVQEADLLFKRGEYEPAAASYRKALLIRPENEPTDYLKFQVGCCYERLQQHESAVAVFRQLLSEEFRSQYRLKTRYRIGECLFKAKHYGEARKAYYRAIALSGRAGQEDERKMLEDAYFKVGDCFRKEAELVRVAQSAKQPAIGAYAEF